MAVAVTMFEDFMLDPQREARSKVRAVLLNPSQIDGSELPEPPREIEMNTSMKVVPSDIPPDEWTHDAHPELNPFTDHIPAGFKQQPLG